jgi:hypothetical protein
MINRIDHSEPHRIVHGGSWRSHMSTCNNMNNYVMLYCSKTRFAGFRPIKRLKNRRSNAVTANE